MSKGIYAHFLPAPSFDIDDLLLKRIERGSARYYAVGWALIQKWLPIDLILWSIESQNVLLKKFIWFPLGYLRVIGPRSQLATIFGLWPTLLCNCKKKIVAVGVHPGPRIDFWAMKYLDEHQQKYLDVKITDVNFEFSRQKIQIFCLMDSGFFCAKIQIFHTFLTITHIWILSF